jgi:hypothetical protein
MWHHVETYQVSHRVNYRGCGSLVPWDNVKEVPWKRLDETENQEFAKTLIAKTRILNTIHRTF